MPIVKTARQHAVPPPAARRRADLRILRAAAARQGGAGRRRLEHGRLEQPRPAEPVAQPRGQRRSCATAAFNAVLRGAARPPDARTAASRSTPQTLTEWSGWRLVRSFFIFHFLRWYPSLGRLAAAPCAAAARRPQRSANATRASRRRQPADRRGTDMPDAGMTRHRWRSHARPWWPWAKRVGARWSSSALVALADLRQARTIDWSEVLRRDAASCRCATLLAAGRAGRLQLSRSTAPTTCSAAT